MTTEVSSEYSVRAEDYTIHGKIGQGAFATVYVATCIPNKQKVAIKVIELEPHEISEEENIKDDGDNLLEIQKEAAVMHSLKHPNIVPCYASFVVKDELWLVLPFLSGGSCADIMRDVPVFKKGFKDESLLATLLFDVLSGIAYCHSDGRIHRDIKARNIMLAPDGLAMVGDFGVSAALYEGGNKRRGTKTLTGTPCWMAPEIMQEQKYNHKADIWSLGITALELAFGKPPYADQRPMKVMMSIMNEEPPTVDSMDKKNHFSNKFKNFISKCLIKDINKRPKANDLLTHNFFKLKKDKTYVFQEIVTIVEKFSNTRIMQNPIDQKPRSQQTTFNHNNTKIITTNDNNTANPMAANVDTGSKTWSWSHSEIQDAINTPKADDNEETGGKVGRFTVETGDDSEEE